ncbi:hypothetical protein [Pseudosporangium ferrugineum]|uniref:DUF5666 domain-containing protein n=1 Tax=Pseudosporangium ferrugineum TaxID=439699 RepID=A0A2T0RC56_9ACTN|nr:hypothetical protein [Pseudosporangium ferrugineum]PRY18721.1 hypothetical protein CLV70_14511 [Pseudosporangium ferrugineum]
MTRTRIALNLTTLGLAGLLGLTGCGGAGAPSAAPAGTAADATVLAGFTDELSALTATGLEDDPAPATSARPGHHRARKYLRKNTLHGEVTVQGKDGVRTIAVQRGTVTAVDATSVTVKSSDGVTWTWAFGDKIKIVRDRTAVQPTALKAGDEAGLAGRRDGDRTVARLIRLK